MVGGSANPRRGAIGTVLAYWKFESTPLQQTVRLSRDFSFLYRKAGGCRGVGAGGTVGRDAQGSSTSRQLPATSLSGLIPVPQCRLGGSRLWLNWCAQPRSD